MSRATPGDLGRRVFRDVARRVRLDANGHPIDRGEELIQYGMECVRGVVLTGELPRDYEARMEAYERQRQQASA